MTSTIDRYTKFITEQAKNEKTSGFRPHSLEEMEILNEVSLAKSLKRGMDGWDTTFPRFNDLNDPSKGINHGRPKEVVRNTRNHSDKFLYSIHKITGLNPDSPAGLQQRVARNELERRRESGKLDPKYHIKQDNIETKRIFPPPKR
jgi:hypothetical protein